MILSEWNATEYPLVVHPGQKVEIHVVVIGQLLRNELLTLSLPGPGTITSIKVEGEPKVPKLAHAAEVSR